MSVSPRQAAPVSMYPASPPLAPPSAKLAFSGPPTSAAKSPLRDSALREIDDITDQVNRLFGSGRPTTSEPLPFLYTSTPLFPTLGGAAMPPGTAPESRTAAALQSEIFKLKQRLAGAVAAVRDALAHESAERKRAQSSSESALLRLADVQRERDELHRECEQLRAKLQIDGYEVLAGKLEAAQRSDVVSGDRAVRAEAEIRALRARCEAQASAVARLEAAVREERGLREATERQLAAERKAAEAAAERALKAAEGVRGSAEAREMEAEWRGRLAAEKRVMERAHESEISLYREAVAGLEKELAAARAAAAQPAPDPFATRALEEALREKAAQEAVVRALTEKIARLEGPGRRRPASGASASVPASEIEHEIVDGAIEAAVHVAEGDAVPA